MKFEFSSRAEEDLSHIFLYLKENANKEILTKLIKSLDKMIVILISNPEIGGNNFSNISKKVKVKTYLLSGFKYMVFYDYNKDRVRVGRILHTSRDINNILFS